MIRKKRLLLAFILVAILATPGLEARADDASPDAAALALFAEGRRLMAAGDFAGACPKFAESKRLAPGVGMTLNLALCYEGLGKTASAWSQYLEAAAAAHAKGQTEREAAAKARAARLEPLLLRATIVVAPQVGTGQVTIKVDGRPLPNELLGTATPLDPGPHRVEATAPGMNAWVSTIDVQPGPTPTVRVPALTPLAEPSEPAPTAEAPVPPPGGPAKERPEARNAANGTGMRTAGIALGAAGATAIGVGLAFALAGNAEKDSSQAFCVIGHGCLPQGQSDLSSARTDADIASVAIPLGLAAAIGGAILWLEAPRAAPVRTGHFAIAPHVSLNRWSLTATEAW